MRLGWVLTPVLLFSGWAQNTQLQSVRKIYVDGFGNKPGASKLQEALAQSLRKIHQVELVSSADQADAVISGEGELWIKGYSANNMRVRYVTQDARPIYTGYLSVELKNKRQETLWSYLSAPRHAESGDSGQAIASEIVRKLEAAIGSK
jgi:hypothetical protein